MQVVTYGWSNSRPNGEDGFQTIYFPAINAGVKVSYSSCYGRHGTRARHDPRQAEVEKFWQLENRLSEAGLTERDANLVHLPTEAEHLAAETVREICERLLNGEDVLSVWEDLNTPK